MSSIFANATITLAASSAIDAEYGMLRLREPSSDSPHCRLTFRDLKGVPSGCVKVVYIRPTIENITKSIGPLKWPPLEARGWTLQERLLSTRVLSFEENKTWWECLSCRMVESLHVCMKPHALDSFRPEIAKQPLLDLSHDQIYRWWLIALGDFCKRQLTYAEDLLPAVAGLASVVSRVTGDTYLAGLWQQDLGRGLMWSSGQPGWPRWQPQTPDLSAPSWSWARSEMRVCHGEYS